MSQSCLETSAGNVSQPYFETQISDTSQSHAETQIGSANHLRSNNNGNICKTKTIVGNQSLYEIHIFHMSPFRFEIQAYNASYYLYETLTHYTSSQ